MAPAQAAILKRLRSQIARARRIYATVGTGADAQTFTGTDSLILQAGFATMTARYICLLGNARRSWTVRFATDRPAPDEVLRWLAGLH